MTTNALYPNKRLLTIREAIEYTGMGITALRAWGVKHKCMKKIGRRTYFDRTLVDQVVDAIPPVTEKDSGENE